ncbi:MAG: hypothetical protein ACOC1O_02600 [bacterium]
MLKIGDKVEIIGNRKPNGLKYHNIPLNEICAVNSVEMACHDGIFLQVRRDGNGGIFKTQFVYKKHLKKIVDKSKYFFLEYKGG